MPPATLTSTPGRTTARLARVTPRPARRKREALFAACHVDRQRDVHRDHAASTRGEDGRSVHERERLAGQTRVLDQQVRRDGHAHPTVFQDVDGERSVANGNVIFYL